jgi:hypothetical protein
MNIVMDMDMDMNMDMDMDIDMDMGSKRFRCRTSDSGEEFIPTYEIMSDSTLFSSISKVPISGSVQYCKSRISGLAPSYGDHRYSDRRKCDRSHTIRWQPAWATNTASVPPTEPLYT